ncbi:spermidine synthase [Flavobacterium sp.]|uniref:spermidine synthase n=1 Tax=Flavobacterium sp. TaxID=239 RepID=UPI00261F7BD8|nr:spermidine synthase [Flavobacterium sp.]
MSIQPTLLQKLKSYFVPVCVERFQSDYNGLIEINCVSGKLVVDSENTNYSYGSLQKILKYGLIHVGYSRIRRMERILVLGLAGGSILETLQRDVRFEGAVTCVDIDRTLVERLQSCYAYETNQNVSIVFADAFDFVLRNTEKYDLVIVDIFIDTKLPDFLFELHFLKKLFADMPAKGILLFNTMVLTTADRARNDRYLRDIAALGLEPELLTKVEPHTELICIEKR